MIHSETTITDTPLTTCATTNVGTPPRRLPRGRPLHGQGKHAYQQVHRVMARLKGDDGAKGAYYDHKLNQWILAKVKRARLIARGAAQAERIARKKRGDLRDNTDLDAALDFKGRPGVLAMFNRGF